MVNPTLQEALWNLLCLQTVSLEKIMRILCVYDGQSLVVHKKMIFCCLWLFSIYLGKL